MILIFMFFEKKCIFYLKRNSTNKNLPIYLNVLLLLLLLLLFCELKEHFFVDSVKGLDK